VREEKIIYILPKANHPKTGQIGLSRTGWFNRTDWSGRTD
jgi:hypothetical protein